MIYINTLCFWFATIVSIISIYNMYLCRKTEIITEREVKFTNKTYWCVLGSIILIALLVRGFQFGSIPGGFNQDGAMAAVDAKALADYGTDRFGMRYPAHLTAWGYGQMSALLSYLMVPFIKVMGLTPIAVRLPQLIMSLIGLTCLYFFILEEFGKTPALFVACMAAINPWHILQSRWALDCNLYPHFFIVGIFLLCHGLKAKKRMPFIVISMISFGLCMYCYGVSIYTMPLFLLMTCIYLLVSKKISWLEAVVAFVIYMVVAGPFILVMAINTFGWETIETPLFTLPYFPDSVRSNDILFFSDHIGAQLVSNAKSLLAITVYQNKDLPWNDVTGFGTIYLFSVPFVIAGCVAICRYCRKKTGAMCILFFLLTGIWCGLVTNGVNINRLNIIYYPMLILAGLGVWQVVSYFHIFKIEYGILLAYLIAFGVFCFTYFTSYAQDTNYYFMKDFGDAVSYIDGYDVDKMYITSDSQYAGSAQVSEILTMFYQQIDAEYYQGVFTEDDELPYAEKYVYFQTGNAYGNLEENAAYVVTQAELGNFDTQYYNITQFGAYYAVTRK